MIGDQQNIPMKTIKTELEASQVIKLLMVACLGLLAAVAGNELQGNENVDRNPAERRSAFGQVDRLLIMTTAPNVEDEDFKRFNRSIETYKLDLSVLRRPEKSSSQLGLIKKALATYKSETNLLIMIVDSQKSIISGNQNDIVSRLKRFDPKSRVIFSAGPPVGPTSAASESSAPPTGDSRHLNSGAYISFASALWELLNLEPEAGGLDLDGGQSYFARIYSNRTLRERVGLELDKNADLFQTLRGNDNLDLGFDSGEARLKNLASGSEPIVVVGDDENKMALNSLGNYLAKAWTPEHGCRYCDRDKLTLPREASALPSVLIGVFIESATPFIGEFFEDLLALDYPSAKLHLVLHNSVAYHEKLVQRFIAEHGARFATQQVIESSQPEWEARDLGLRRCSQLSCDYYFALDSVARIELADTLRILIETNKTVVAPLLSRPTKLWSNFWAAMTEDGYYARSSDYVELVRRDRVGLWDVAHVMNAYLLSGQFVRDNLQPSGGRTTTKLTHRDRNPSRSLQPVLVFTRNLRESNVHLHMINTHEFGHLVDPSNYNSSLTHPDLYQLAENVLDWERAYLHENYSRLVEEDDLELEQPCPDVFWFPLVSDRFARQLLETMETFGQWSGGTNHDPRIEGGYESVPTRDIHLKQVGLHQMWLLFLRDYVMPVQLKEFVGYEHDPPRAELAFVVRYHPAEQAALQPHHDSSTYTLNIALNSPGLDYEGGGCRFERYNCSVTESRRGWALMHPGRLTHYHEGLPVSSGTRYIMVTFIDP